MRLLTENIAFAGRHGEHGGRLWFSDVHNYALKTVDLEGVVETVAAVSGRPAGMGFVRNGRLLLATALDRKLSWVGADGELELACSLAGVAKGPLNDMVVDGNGHAYVGDIGFNFAAGETPGRGVSSSTASVICLA